MSFSDDLRECTNKALEQNIARDNEKYKKSRALADKVFEEHGSKWVDKAVSQAERKCKKGEDEIWVFMPLSLVFLLFFRPSVREDFQSKVIREIQKIDNYLCVSCAYIDCSRTTFAIELSW